jgi:Bifunctional DNA primase/polymerase, N-terminal
MINVDKSANTVSNIVSTPSLVEHTDIVIDSEQDYNNATEEFQSDIEADNSVPVDFLDDFYSFCDDIELALEDALEFTPKKSTLTKKERKNPYAWKRHPRSAEIVVGLRKLHEILPKWNFTPVGDFNDPKAAFLPKWQTRRDEIELTEQHISTGVETVSTKGNTYTRYATGFGLLTGEASDGIITIDCDNQGAIDLMQEWELAYGEPLPVTPTWTSGKPGRKQMVFQVPPETRSVIKDMTNVKVKGDGWELDFRYNSCQSCLPPSMHPETGSYKWINSPEDTEIAPLPDWLCEKVINMYHVDTLEKKISEPPKPRVKPGEFVGVASGSLITWLNTQISLSDPYQLFNSPNHEWKGNKGLSLWYDEFPEYSCSPFKKNDGTWILREHALKLSISAVTYQWSVNLNSLSFPEDAKGKNFIAAVKSLAERMGWGDIPNQYSPERYREAIASEQKEIAGLDIGKFDKIITSTGKYIDIDKVKSELPNSGYVLCSNVPMGAGKTTLAKELFKDRSIRVTAITPTISLGKSLTDADSLGLTMRDEIVSEENKDYASGLLEQETRLGICYPSLWQIADRHGDILFLDETFGGLEFLFNAEGIFSPEQGKTRSDCVSAFVRLLKQHDKIVLFDAFVNNIVIDFVKSVRPDLEFILVDKEVQASDRQVYLVSDEFIETKINEELTNGKKIAIACDSIDKVKALEAKFTDMGKVVISVHRQNSTSKENQELLTNPTKYLSEVQHDVFVYSPTFGAGASVDAVVHYDFVFGINTHLAASTFCQMLKRVRKEVPLYYSVASGGSITGCQSPLSVNQKHWLLNNVNGNLLAHIAETKGKKLAEEIGTNVVDTMPSIWNSLLADDETNLSVETSAKLRAISAYESVDRVEKIHDRLRSQGYSVTVIVNEEKASEKEIAYYVKLGYRVSGIDAEAFKADAKNETKTYKEKNRLLEAKQVTSCELISEEEFKQLDKKNVPSPEEQLKISRYKLEKTIPQFTKFIEVNSSEDEKESKVIESYKSIFLDDKRHWLRGVSNFIKLTNLDKQISIENRDINKLFRIWEGTGTATVQDASYLKSAAYRFLIEDVKFLELLDISGEKIYLSTYIKNVCETLCDSKSKVQKFSQYFNLTPLKMTKNTSHVKWVNQLLDRFSLKLVTKKTVNGERFYGVEKTELISINGFREFIETIELEKLNERFNGNKTESSSVSDKASEYIEEYHNHQVVEAYSPASPEVKELSEQLVESDEIDIIEKWETLNIEEKNDLFQLLCEKSSKSVEKLCSYLKMNPIQISINLMDEILGVSDLVAA